MICYPDLPSDQLRSFALYQCHLRLSTLQLISSFRQRSPVSSSTPGISPITDKTNSTPESSSGPPRPVKATLQPMNLLCAPTEPNSSSSASNFDSAHELGLPSLLFHVLVADSQQEAVYSHLQLFQPVQTPAERGWIDLL
jgi:hypothetical protein